MVFVAALVLAGREAGVGSNVVAVLEARDVADLGKDEARGVRTNARDGMRSVAFVSFVA